MKLASAFRNTATMVALVHGETGELVDVNPAFERRLGYRADELLGKRPSHLGLWDDAQAQAVLWARLRAGLPVHSIPTRFIDKAGQIAHGRVSCEPIHHHGQRYVLALLVEAEEEGREGASDQSALIESYRTLFMSAVEGIFRCLPGGGFIDANPAMANLLGFPDVESLLQLPASEASALYVDPGRRAQLRRRMERMGWYTDERSQVRRCDGSVVWISENCRLVRHPSGRIAYYEGTAFDISDRLASEAALKQSEALYKVLVDSCRDAVFLIQRGRIRFCNQAMADMLGMTREALTGSEYMPLIHPDDLAAQARRRKEREAGDTHIQRYQVRVLHAAGHHVMADVLADAVMFEGDIASTGVMRDITEERQYVRALEQAERRYRELFESSPAGLFKAHVDGRVLETNRALLTMLDHDAGEGDAPREIQFNEVFVDEEARKDIFRALRSAGEVNDREAQLLTRTGRAITCNLSVRAIGWEQGAVTLFAGSLVDITRQREAEQRLRFHASHDPLTGLPNRLLFQDMLERVLAEAKASDRHDYAVLFLDLDGFKLVNDSLGHAAGDQLLIELAQRINRALKGHALVSRYGGDEFTILPVGACDEARAITLAEQVIALFEQAFEIGEQLAYSSASIGIVMGHARYHTPIQVLRDADTAMYRAKAAGKSGYMVFDAAMHHAAQARFALETDLRQALDGDQFVVHYQPLVSLADNRIVGCEALVRWQHPSRGLLYPDAFLSVAEEMGLIARIDHWVMRTACAQVAAWQATIPGHDHLGINVNLDDRQMSSQTLVDEVAQVLADTGLAPNSLRLEVTESVFRTDRVQIEGMLAALKQLGVMLVVDDFGTGYSSLESLASASFDALKIDRCFINDIETNPRHRAIVRTIVEFAKDLDLNLTAEGVETARQASLLRELGCPLGQGYLFAKAMEARAFGQLLVSSADGLGSVY
ncbi:MAG TPA: EAL domain-containing protein [Chiayiivirga sp.]|nr:EAL domain-containing protein [Chiayiivirga sp.]